MDEKLHVKLEILQQAGHFATQNNVTQLTLQITAAYKDLIEKEVTNDGK